MNRVFLGLGGNVGESREYLSRACAALERRCGKLVCTSALYESEAWGMDSSKVFLNQVLELETELPAEKLLSEILQIEVELGRTRGHTGYTDRTIDIDILFFNDSCIETEHLRVPHPHLSLRRFVLLPLTEIAPEFQHPVLGKNMRQLLEDCRDTLRVNLLK